MAKRKAKPFTYYDLLRVFKHLCDEHDVLLGFHPKMTDRQYAVCLRKLHSDPKVFKKWQKIKREMHLVLQEMEKKKWITVRFQRRR